MALTTDFPGSSLPAGWTVDSPVGGETITVSDSRVHITVPSGIVYNSIFTTGSSDGSAGVVHDIETGSFDIAVQCDTDPTGTQNFGWAIIVKGATDADMARFSLIQTDGVVGRIFCYARAGGSGAGTGLLTISAEPPFSGLWQWGRVTYDGAGNWDLLGSVDGVNWTLIAELTRTFTPERFKVGMTSTDPTRPGGTVRINQVVDVAAAGTTDLRAPIFDRTPVVNATIVGNEGSLPAGWSNDSANSGMITWPGSVMRLSSDIDTNGSRARLSWSGDTFKGCGILAKIQYPQATSVLFVVIGIGAQTGNPSDQYSLGPGYIWELNGSNNRRFLRVDQLTDVTGFEGPYARLLADALGAGTNARWIRVERNARRVRARHWLDGSPEPSTWAIDTQDEVYGQLDMGPVIGASHNDGTAGAFQSVDISNVQFYELPPPTVGSAGVASVTTGGPADIDAAALILSGGVRSTTHTGTAEITTPSGVVGSKVSSITVTGVANITSASPFPPLDSDFGLRYWDETAGEETPMPVNPDQIVGLEAYIDARIAAHVAN